VARALGVRALFAERKDGAFALRRGFGLVSGERVAVIEGVFTTGGSTREVCATVETAGGRVVAVGSLVDRGVAMDAFSVPARSLISLPIPAWLPEDCPLCVTGIALDTPGSRHRG
jgi:orotate phosphoribosyltransferase